MYLIDSKSQSEGISMWKTVSLEDLTGSNTRDGLSGGQMRNQFTLRTHFQDGERPGENSGRPCKEEKVE